MDDNDKDKSGSVSTHTSPTKPKKRKINKRYNDDDDEFEDGQNSFDSDEDESTDDHQTEDSAHSLFAEYNLANQTRKKMLIMNRAHSTHVSPLLKGMNINPLDPKIFPCSKSRWVPDKTANKCQCCDGKFSKKRCLNRESIIVVNVDMLYVIVVVIRN